MQVNKKDLISAMETLQGYTWMLGMRIIFIRDYFTNYITGETYRVLNNSWKIYGLCLIMMYLYDQGKISEAEFAAWDIYIDYVTCSKNYNDTDYLSTPLNKPLRDRWIEETLKKLKNEILES